MTSETKIPADNHDAVAEGMHRFIVVMPGGSVRGSYSTEKQAREAATKYGFTVIEVTGLRILSGDEAPQHVTGNAELDAGSPNRFDHTKRGFQP